MAIENAEFFKGFIRMADDGWQQGWHERNGGNLSYRIKAEEIEEIKSDLDFSGQWKDIGTSVPDLCGEFFLVTGSGKYFRNVILDPADSIAVIEVDGKGEKLSLIHIYFSVQSKRQPWEAYPIFSER